MACECSGTCAAQTARDGSYCHCCFRASWLEEQLCCYWMHKQRNQKRNPGKDMSANCHVTPNSRRRRRQPYAERNAGRWKGGGMGGGCRKEGRKGITDATDSALTAEVERGTTGASA
jgi:hypothetical protein